MNGTNLNEYRRNSNVQDQTDYFFVDKVNEKFPGFSKIIDKIKDVFIDAEVINSLDGRTRNERIVPLGIVASNLFLKKFKKGGIAFMMDSSTLCFASMARFYLKRRLFFNKYLIGAVLRYIKYYFIEKKVIRNFDKVIVVSEHDASYLEKKYNCSNVEVISNGSDFPDLSKKKLKDFDFTLGILSYWGAGNHHDVDWFFAEYLPFLKKKYPNIKIITAGRAADDYTLNLFQQYDIEHLGEIDDLWDFFNKIDVYITTLRKECGILNKVLDAMAHQKVVVGLEHNMYAFKSLKEGYFTYKNLEELIHHLETIKTNPELVKSKVNSSYNFISEHHRWVKNYQKMKAMIDTYHTEKFTNFETKSATTSSANFTKVL
ncbi:glycosyltransferase family 1 protein [bacterium]|nr:MAG: glycosyltransferase family 1 protein [bacterium]